MEGRDLERRVSLGRLMGFYGPLMTEHRREMARLYCEEDLSLQEIADTLTEAGKPVTRQGVYDAIVKAERQLNDYENKLGLIHRYDRMVEEAKRCLAYLETGAAEAARDSLKKMTEL